MAPGLSVVVRFCDVSKEWTDDACTIPDLSQDCKTYFVRFTATIASRRGGGYDAFDVTLSVEDPTATDAVVIDWRTYEQLAKEGIPQAFTIDQLSGGNCALMWKCETVAYKSFGADGVLCKNGERSR